MLEPTNYETDYSGNPAKLQIIFKSCTKMESMHLRSNKKISTAILNSTSSLNWTMAKFL